MSHINQNKGPQGVSSALSQDCQFILQAVQQLKEGTCCDQADIICTWDLLPRIKEALQEHIAFEERWLFPQLSREKMLLHQEEHAKLSRILGQASWELECGYGDQFKFLMDELQKALTEHHQNDQEEKFNPLSCAPTCNQDDDLKKIRTRTISPWEPLKVS